MDVIRSITDGTAPRRAPAAAAKVDADADRGELEATAKKLEAVFMSMLAKQLRETMSEDGLFGDGPGAEIYSGFFDQIMGEKLSDRGGVGIAELIVRDSLRRGDSKDGESAARLDALVREQAAAAGYGAAARVSVGMDAAP